MSRRSRSARPPVEKQAPLGTWRDRLAWLAALVIVGCLGSAFLLAKDLQFLVPGPLTSAHSAIENCSACHTQSGGGKLSWVRSLVAGDPHADSQACLTCHKMPSTAFNAHGASADVLEQSTERLTKIAARMPTPLSALAQNIAFPTDVVGRGLYCATCHQEHQGVNFNLSKISNEQCRSCHVVKFDSFDGHHPQFESYPFRRRTRIIYDHPGHALQHYPATAEKDPARRIPATCSTCHDSREDRRIMGLTPGLFERACTSCHLDQITGKARPSGPKGIAFLALPGLDLQTLRAKASIGEWPAASEAELTPFMKVMISRNERGRALIKAVESLNLQDLTDASDAQIAAVAGLVWEIKRLFYVLISGKASDVLADLNVGGGTKLSGNLVADLTASIPRDVVISAYQQWLPNLGTEIANRQHTASIAKPSQLAQPNRRTLTKSAPGPLATEAAAATGEGAVRKPATPNVKPDGGKRTLSAQRSSSALAESGLDGSESPERRLGSDRSQRTPSLGQGTVPSEIASKGKPNQRVCVVIVFGYCMLTRQVEDAPEAIKSRGATKSPGRAKEAGHATQPNGGVRKDDNASARPDSAASPDAASWAATIEPTNPTDLISEAAEPQARAAPMIGIESNVDSESWAEYGGWYRQDYAIFYRPTGHKDKFIYSWLVLTGPQAPKGDKSPAAAVFNFLTRKGAQGACTRCHSIDDIQGKGRLVNFSPAKVETKHGRFTNFIHEPHFGIMEDRGCLTCHNIERGNAYLQSYEQGSPTSFASNFGTVKKDLCQTCHTRSMARQDCLLCHKYHVNGIITPIINTRVPVPTE